MNDTGSYLPALTQGELFMVVFIFGIVATATSWPRAGERLAMRGQSKHKDSS